MTPITTVDIPFSMEPLLTIKQLSSVTGFTERQIRHLIKSYRLPTYRVSGIRIRHSEFLAWIETRRVG